MIRGGFSWDPKVHTPRSRVNARTPEHSNSRTFLAGILNARTPERPNALPSFRGM